MKIPSDTVKLSSVISSLTHIVQEIWTDGSDYGFKWGSIKGPYMAYDHINNKVTLYARYCTHLSYVQIMAIRGVCATESLTYYYNEYGM